MSTRTFLSSLAASSALVAALALPAPAIAHSSWSACSCTIGTEDLGFGTYNSGQAAALDGSSIVWLQCWDGAFVANVKIGRGQYPVTGARQMVGPKSSKLKYELYSDASRKKVIGTVSLGSKKKKYHQVVLYGRVFGGQDVTNGGYQDVINVTVLP